MSERFSTAKTGAIKAMASRASAGRVSSAATK
jgi:hypothetical protein